MTLSRIVDDRGAVIGYVSTSEDVDDRVRAHEAIVEALEVERRAVERLREVDQVKDTFVSAVSHELRTPITSIVGYLEMLQDGSFGDLNREQYDAVGRVNTNSRRLLTLIDELLTLSKVAGRRPRARRPRRPRPRDGRPDGVRRGGAVVVGARPRRPPATLPDGAGALHRRRGDARADGGQPARQRREVHARGRPGRRSSCAGTTAAP